MRLRTLTLNSWLIAALGVSAGLPMAARVVQECPATCCCSETPSDCDCAMVEEVDARETAVIKSQPKVATPASNRAPIRQTAFALRSNLHASAAAGRGPPLFLQHDSWRN